MYFSDKNGKAVIRKQLKRNQVLAYFANLPASLIGLEACGGSHYWVRELINLGHDARLISPQLVKPYVKGNKNDANDAEAICEAVSRPNMRFVPLKGVEQQDIQMLHRIRSGSVKERTALANRIRGLLGEYGIVVAVGLATLRRQLPDILEDAENGLTAIARQLFADLQQQLVEADKRVGDYGKKIQTLHEGSEVNQRLAQIPGIGPITATALLASLGDGKAFSSPRQVAAWLGLVPRQSSSGGKPKLQRAQEQAWRRVPADAVDPRGQVGRQQGRRQQGRQPEPLGQRRGEAAQPQHCGGGGRQQACPERSRRERQGGVGIVDYSRSVRDAKPSGNGKRGVTVEIKVSVNNRLQQVA
jgi:transposase